MKVNNTQDISNHYLNVLIYGQPGSGKTTFAGTVQHKAKTLILSAESGLLSLRNLKDKEGKPLNIDYVSLNNFGDIEEAFKHLHMEKHDYKAVVMDSGTEIQQVCMDYILHQERRDRPQLQDWGTLNNKMVRMIRSFRDLPMHFIMTALEETDTDQTTGEVRVTPQFQGKLGKTISAYFDEVLYAYTRMNGSDKEKAIKYHMLTNNSGKFIGKDRSGQLPLVMDNPTFASMYDLIFKPVPHTETKKEDANESNIQPGRPGRKN